MIKMVKCQNCKKRLKRTYIRENLDNNKRTWKGIGFYCLKCHQFFIIQKNENIPYKNIQ